MNQDPFPASLKKTMKGQVTQAKLAEKVDISLGYMSDLVNGKRTGGDQLRRKIAEALDYSDYESFLDVGRRELGIEPVRVPTNYREEATERATQRYNGDQDKVEGFTKHYDDALNMTVAEFIQVYPEAGKHIRDAGKLLMKRIAITLAPDKIADWYVQARERLESGDKAVALMFILGLASAITVNLKYHDRVKSVASNLNIQPEKAAETIARMVDFLEKIKFSIVGDQDNSNVRDESLTEILDWIESYIVYLYFERKAYMPGDEVG